MDKRRILLIINPISGTSKKKGLEGFVVSRLLRLGWQVDVEFTRGHGDATRLAGGAVTSGYNAVIAAGGDGTVNEAATALCDTGVALGIIPCGSGNGLARHLNIPVDIGESLGVIERDHVSDIDYGIINGRKFFCTCGVGFDAVVSEKFASQGHRGLVTYLKSVLAEFHGYRPAEYTIRVGDDVITERAFLVAVCNASQYGNNAYIAPDATIDDGLLDVTVIHSAGPLRTAFAGFDMLVGNINKNTLISHFKVASTEITRSDEGPIHIDGEPEHLDGSLKIGCHHHGLKVFAPANTHRFIPFITPAALFMRDSRLAIKHLLGIR